MARIFKLTDEAKQDLLDKLREDFEQSLKTVDANTSSITLTVKKMSERKRTNLYFTTIAYAKILSLIKSNSKEVGWHGTAYRIESGYLIKDVFVYPQVVNSVHIDTDEAEYSNWLYDFDNETFQNIRFHGHSHVDMEVSPSNTDLKHREDLVSQIRPDGFYIFMIGNKKSDFSFEIIDKMKNIVYNTEDINIDIIIDDDKKMSDFIEESNKNVKEYQPTYRSKYFSGASKKNYANNNSSAWDDNYGYYDDYDNDDDDWGYYYSKSKKKNNQSNTFKDDFISRQSNRINYTL